MRLSKSSLWVPKCWDDVESLPESCIVARNPAPRIISVSPGVVLKVGARDLTEEIRATQFAYSVGGLLAPKVLFRPRRTHRFDPTLPYDPFDRSNQMGAWYYCMEHVPGVSLEKVVDQMSLDELQDVAAQLKQILARMASIRPPSGKIGSVSGGPFRSYLISSILPVQHAFDSVGDFYDHWRRILRLMCTENFTESLLSHFPRNARVHFAHIDLIPRNIMVEGTKITGIIDWDLAGFYPDYWEYARMHDPVMMSPGWDKLLSMVFPGERRQEEIVAVRSLIDVLGNTFLVF